MHGPKPYHSETNNKGQAAGRLLPLLLPQLGYDAALAFMVEGPPEKAASIFSIA